MDDEAFHWVAVGFFSSFKLRWMHNSLSWVLVPDLVWFFSFLKRLVLKLEKRGIHVLGWHFSTISPKQLHVFASVQLVAQSFQDSNCFETFLQFKLLVKLV